MAEMFEPDPGRAARERLRRLTDQTADTYDPMYHMQVALFGHWIDLTALALRDEGVSDDVARAVLSRLAYGVPSAFDAHRRLADFRERVGASMVTPPGSLLPGGRG